MRADVPDAVALSARMNEAAVLDDTDATNVELSSAERDTVLVVLDDPPYALYELRDELARDLRDGQ